MLRDNRIVPLPPKVLDRLVVLTENDGLAGQVCRRQRLMHNIFVLRNMLAAACPNRKPYIETSPWQKYRFTGTV